MLMSISLIRFSFVAMMLTFLSMKESKKASR